MTAITVATNGSSEVREERIGIKGDDRQQEQRGLQWSNETQRSDPSQRRDKFQQPDVADTPGLSIQEKPQRTGGNIAEVDQNAHQREQHVGDAQHAEPEILAAAPLGGEECDGEQSVSKRECGANQLGYLRLRKIPVAVGAHAGCDRAWTANLHPHDREASHDLETRAEYPHSQRNVALCGQRDRKRLGMLHLLFGEAWTLGNQLPIGVYRVWKHRDRGEVDGKRYWRSNNV